MACQILERQATYWDLLNDSGRVRIHFRGKEEASFASPFADDYEILGDHPVLVDYREPWDHLYVTNAIGEPGAALEAVELALAPTLAGWRSTASYMTRTDPARMLREGYGELMYAPRPLIALAISQLSPVGVGYRVLPGQAQRWPRSALIIGDSFVVATAFHVAAA